MFTLFVISTQISTAQNYADKEYFLIDSLDISKVSNQDKFLMDSCLSLYHSSKDDTAKITAITTIVEESWDNNVWPKYNLWIYNHSLKKLNESPNTKTKRFLLNSLSGAINNIGYNYKTQGDIKKALEYYHKSLRIKEAINDKKGIAVGLNNIGIIFDDQGDIDKAISYYEQCLEIQLKIKDKIGVARSYSNIGLAYYNQSNMLKAIEYCHKSIKIQEDIDDKKGLATSLNNLAAIYSKQGNITRSLEYHKKSLAIEKEIGNKPGIAWALINLGRSYARLKNYPLAIDNLNKSIAIGTERGIPIVVQNSALTLSQIYEEQNKGMDAYKMHKLYINMRDSINNEKNLKASAEQEARYEYEKQKTIDDAEHKKLIAIKNKEKEKQTIISIATAFGLILVIVFLIFVFSRLKITRKQKQVIEHQNSEIVDSITYAKRIQKAILPTDDYINKYLPNSFILYKPKDIVAGDFYWVTNINDKVYFAAADCTGHGVPGAMVSVVCHNALDRVLREFKLTKPADILNKTREIVEKQLNKSSAPSTSINNIRDGMDIALCCLNKTNNELEYAGAYNPLWILRNGTEEIEEIKATRQSIGRIETPKPFEPHTVKLNPGDSIYIFSDGFADQFGGAKGKKLMHRKFKKLLIGMIDKDIMSQKEIINNYFESWKGNMEQIDDVCVIGIRI